MVKHITRKYFGLGSIAWILLLLFTSCDDGKSYSELLRDEDHAVNWYLAQCRVETSIPKDSVFEVGADAPFYRMNSDGSVYMRVVRLGTGEKPKKGDTVYYRFMRQNIKYLYDKSNMSAGEGNANDMSSSLGGLSFVFGSNTLATTLKMGEGIQVPLKFLNYDCEVDLIVKSTMGFTEEMSECNPYVYNHMKYFKAEY
ncbi:MAG: DUF4827 domain-containing protein [Muribaculaceae bacterium]|nr:DUF4827 domain-containing protein [Muribaculaceae bacterium]